MSKFIIEVRTKGFGDAKRQMSDVAKETRKFSDESERMRGRTKGLIGSLGSLRNQLLVYTFALGGATAFMLKFVKAASGFEDVKTRLVGLTGSVQAAEQAFEAFNEVAAQTPFTLDDVTNAGAQLQAFGLDAEATLQVTADLAAFMGTTATEAANSLGRAFAGGAGAADILRERGILNLIKDFQGIEDITKLTLPEFRVALLESMAQPAAGIAGSSERMKETWTGAVSNMNDAITRFNAKVGAEMMPIMKTLVNSTADFFRTLQIDDLKRYLLDIAVLATGYKLAGAAANIAATGTFRLATAMTLVVKASRLLGVGLLIAAFDHFVALVQEGSITLSDNYIPQIKKLTRNKRTLADTTVDNTEKLQAFIAKLDEEAQVTAEVNDAIMSEINAKYKRIEALMIESATMETTNVVTKAYIEAKIRGNEISEIELALLQQIQSQKERIAADTARDAVLEAQLLQQMQDATDAINDRIDAMRSLKDEVRAVSEENQANMVAEISGSEQLGQLEALRIETANKMASAMKTLTGNETEFFDTMFEGQSIQELLNADMTQFNAIAEGSGAVLTEYQLQAGLAAKEILKLDKEQKEVNRSAQIAAASLNGVAGAIRLMKAEADDPKQRLQGLIQLLAGIVAITNPVAGAAINIGGALIAHTGGLVQNNGIQRFATGGMVQGQDNVPILAQAGEFVMQRSAVQNIGVQNLAAMNSGQSAGGVTVNIQGNMIGNDEFVRDNLLPQIRKAAQQDLA